MAGAAILGISPGTKYIGIVVLYQGELMESKVASFKGLWSADKLERITAHISAIIHERDILHIACKRHHESRTSIRVEAILESVKEMALQLDIALYTYTIEELKGLFQMHFHNKHVLSEHIIKRFPELYDIFIQERKNKNKYHYKMFEALAACLYCHASLQS
jgi:hypothetical protein